MRFHVNDQGTDIAVPDPESDPRLQHFVRALDALWKGDGAGDNPTILLRDVRASRPKKDVGRVAIQRCPPSTRLSVDAAGPQPEGAKATDGGLHHVVIMRQAALVVRYLAGPPPVAAGTGYAGVFQCRPDVDAAFRESEPPTHDDWVPKAVRDRTMRVYVNRAIQDIRRIMQEIAQPVSLAGAAGDGGLALAGVADSLGELFPNLGGPGGRRPSHPTRVRAGEFADIPVEASAHGAAEGRGGAGRRSAATPATPAARASMRPGHPFVTTKAGVMQRVFPLSLRVEGAPVTLTAAVQFLSGDGGIEKEPPQGGLSADDLVVWWSNLSAGVTHEGSSIRLDPDDATGDWEVRVACPEEVMLALDVRVQEAE